MFETTATLYSETITQDEALNEIKKYTPRTVLIRRSRSIYANEFYQAATQGLKPAAVLVLFFGDYEDETVVGWEGKVYNVARTYRRPDSDDLELTLEERLEFFEGIEEES